MGATRRNDPSVLDPHAVASERNSQILVERSRKTEERSKPVREERHSPYLPAFIESRRKIARAGDEEEMVTRVYAGNLVLETRVSLLFELFKRCGQPVRVSRIAAATNGQREVYGVSTIEFDKPTPVKAIMRLNGRIVDGRELQVFTSEKVMREFEKRALDTYQKRVIVEVIDLA